MERQRAVEELLAEMKLAGETAQAGETNGAGARCFSMEALEQKMWKALELFASEPFFTAKGLEFTYTIKGYEMFVSRKEKSITRSSVLIALEKCIEMMREQGCAPPVVRGPKKLGVFGASYLYPILMHLGVITR